MLLWIANGYRPIELVLLPSIDGVQQELLTVLYGKGQDFFPTVRCKLGMDYRETWGSGLHSILSPRSARIPCETTLHLVEKQPRGRKAFIVFNSLPALA